ncbi:rho GDP dissociation inhibitor [Plakobranchus ocellatus]|uniref:Rho GDP dissociation inhibitor n=1 Tax=Plakobranchus ocellatus TaxID=259542 RepID=A0AAV4DTK0_9GAST|nr:rho GDP dissociation inhibitor [Plakobranchus ocellatus]
MSISQCGLRVFIGTGHRYIANEMISVTVVIISVLVLFQRININCTDISQKPGEVLFIRQGLFLDANNPQNAIIQKLSLLAEGRDEVSIDLTQPLEDIKKESFTIKEGCKYRIKIYFYIQREIVTGLRYFHSVYRKGISVDKMTQMMGSYGPKEELQSFTTQEEEAPQGMLMRGDYKIKSKFFDDDKNQYFNWEWHLSVKKDW